MKTKELKTESLEEMVFRHRNKSYGAYRLRNDYRKVVTIAMIFAIFITSAAFTYPVVKAIYAPKEVKKEEQKIVEGTLGDPPPEQKQQEPPPPPPEPEIEKVKFVAPVVVDSAVDEVFAVQSDLEGKLNTDAPDETPDITISEKKPDVIDQPEKPDFFTVVEESPMFPGGDEAFYTYLAENLNYPNRAKELGIQGRVFVNFIVEPDGTISHITILRGIGGGCDEETLRVVKNMPNWIPGKQRGIPVRVSYNLPIKFTLH